MITDKIMSWWCNLSDLQRENIIKLAYLKDKFGGK